MNQKHFVLITIPCQSVEEPSPRGEEGQETNMRYRKARGAFAIAQVIYDEKTSRIARIRICTMQKPCQSKKMDLIFSLCPGQGYIQTVGREKY